MSLDSIKHYPEMLDEILGFISDNKDEIGKVLINDNYPYALIKIRNEKFDFNRIFKCGSAKVKIKKPDWLQTT